MGLHRCDVVRIVTHGEQTAMDQGMERLDATVHHLRKAGKVTNVTGFGAIFAQPRGGSAGRDDLDSMALEALGERIEPGLVGKRDKRPANRHEIGHSWSFVISWPN